MEKMEKLMKIYIISGLGADERVFYKLDFSDFEVVFIPWILPEKNEELAAYALRMSKYIKEPNPIILGLSFGGIIAIEISKFLPVQKLILLSTAKTKFELPFYFRVLGFTNIAKYLPYKFLASFKIFRWFLGDISKADIQLILTMIQAADASYIKWSVQQIFNWKNTKEPKNYIHIHGMKDRVLLYKNIQNKITVKNGGHFMLMEQSKEISNLIKNAILTI